MITKYLYSYQVYRKFRLVTYLLNFLSGANFISHL